MQSCMASCGVSGAALSDKISFIEDGVAQEVKRQVDIEAAAMTIPSMWLHVQYILSRCNMLNGPLLEVQTTGQRYPYYKYSI